MIALVKALSMMFISQASCCSKARGALMHDLALLEMSRCTMGRGKGLG